MRSTDVVSSPISSSFEKQSLRKVSDLKTTEIPPFHFNRFRYVRVNDRRLIHLFSSKKTGMELKKNRCEVLGLKKKVKIIQNIWAQMKL